MKLVLALLATVAMGAAAQAKGNKSLAHTLVLGQGISSPSNTSQVNYGEGFGWENAAGASLYAGPQVSLMYDQGEKNSVKDSSYGAELGLGNGKVGLAVGYMKYTNETAGVKTESDQTRGRVGFNFGKVALGLGYLAKNHYSAGLLINPIGMHKFGLIYQTNKFDDNTDTDTYGLGYTYDAKKWAFALDASKMNNKKLVSPASDVNDIIKLTPAFLINYNWLVATVGYDFYLSDKNDNYKDTNKFMAGLAVKGEMGQIALYHKYQNDLAAVGTIWF